MSCYHPLRAWRISTGPDSSGVWPITFNPQNASENQPISLPCGKCIGCRFDRSRIWAIRCIHEAKCHKENCFITLTYRNKSQQKSLNIEDYQLFMKRLRKKYEPKIIRFFHCGEYGDNGNAHHHACLFGHEFQDKKLWETRSKLPLYRSSELEKLWPFGFSTIGNVTFESAAYVARYVTKKIYGPISKFTYSQKLPEYITMSRRPGIGKEFLDKYTADIYNNDEIILTNKLKFKPPRYYDNIYHKINPDRLDKLKQNRINKINQKENTYNRLIVKEELQILKSRMLVRSIEQN
nr:MAG: replication initiator protein [Microviridae sp.]